jgi:hypothetical protein
VQAWTRCRAAKSILYFTEELPMTSRLKSRFEG